MCTISPVHSRSPQSFCTWGLGAIIASVPCIIVFCTSLEAFQVLPVAPSSSWLLTDSFRLLKITCLRLPSRLRSLIKESLCKDSEDFEFWPELSTCLSILSNSIGWTQTVEHHRLSRSRIQENWKPFAWNSNSDDLKFQFNWTLLTKISSSIAPHTTWLIQFDWLEAKQSEIEERFVGILKFKVVGQKIWTKMFWLIFGSSATKWLQNDYEICTKYLN